MDDEELCTPSEGDQTVDNVTSYLLPAKSKKIYINTYRDFLDWCSKKNIKSYTENAFIVYFSEKSRSSKASTLWSYYSMLKTTFNLNNNIDISKFTKLISFLKHMSKNYKPKKSKTFSLQEIEKFIYEAPDNQYLMLKVVALFGISGACRRQELLEIQTDDIQDAGSALIVTIRQCLNKRPRTFTVVDNKDRVPSFLEIYRKYASLRPIDTDHNRFFIFYRNNRCTKQPVGINHFGKIPSQIATFLNLTEPDLYTGHSFRRSSASLLTDLGADISAVKRHWGRNSTVAEVNIVNSIEDRKETPKKIFRIGNQELQTQPSTSQTHIHTREVLVHKEKENDPNIMVSNINSRISFIMNVNKWTPLQIEALIDQYKKYPALYNPTHEEHYNENVKNECLSKIVEALQSVRTNVKEIDVISQWKNLVIQYVQAQQTQKTQSYDSDKEFWYFKKMDFLQNFVEALDIKVEEFDEEELFEAEFAAETQQWENGYGDPLASNVRVKDEVEELSSSKSQVDDSSFNDDTETKSCKDGNDIFGEFVASQLKSITDEDVRQDTIFEIHQILHKALKRKPK